MKRKQGTITSYFRAELFSTGLRGGGGGEGDEGVEVGFDADCGSPPAEASRSWPKLPKGPDDADVVSLVSSVRTVCFVYSVPSMS